MTSLRSEHLLAVRGQAGKWPFSSASSDSSAQTDAEKDLKLASHAPNIQEIKDTVVLSAVFGRKTRELCRGAAPEDFNKCRELAGDRLFCSLLRRHAEAYQGMAGASDAKAKCNTIDIMETTVEATKDAKLQEESDKA